ncbi:MAG: hypothetical protein M3Y21_05140 [Candidatus Eremiobacteraeota bacterium]|nr:hypothetical protein [Candidatus Eremiobacteraeota bacterium]
MQRSFLIFTAAAVATSLVGNVAAAPIQKAAKTVSKTPANRKISKYQQRHDALLKASAPADEYFGRLKLSYIGINNTLHDEAIAAGPYTVNSNIITKVHFAEDALLDWQHKYPNDPQLARTFFLMATMQRKIYTADGQDKSWNYFHQLVNQFPNTFFGKTAKKDLQIGFTEHVFALPVPCPATPSPVPSLAPGVKARPTPVPTASPTPAPTAEPTTTPTPSPGAPKRDIISVPCFTPAPPTPSPTPVPTNAPASPVVNPPVTPIPSGSLTPAPTPASRTSPSPAPSAAPSPLPSAAPAPPSARPTPAPPTPVPTKRP